MTPITIKLTRKEFPEGSCWRAIVSHGDDQHFAIETACAVNPCDWKQVADAIERVKLELIWYMGVRPLEQERDHALTQADVLQVT